MAGFTGFADQISEKKIACGEFFPVFDVERFQKNYRLPASYPADTIIEHVQLACFWAIDSLELWQVEQQAKGYDTMSEVPSYTIDGTSRHESFFIRAVSCKAKALLLANYKTMMRNSSAVSDAKESEDTADTWHASAERAIGQIKGTLSINVALL